MSARRTLDFAVGEKPIWCAFCGNYAVLACFLRALAELQVEPARLAIVAGIGCAGRFPAFVRCYGLHVVHGRALPAATGLKIARPDLTVVALGGDGDGLGIGGGHFLNAGRRALDLTYLFFDNGVYGMTKGQASPTTPAGARVRAAPQGNPDSPLDPAQLAILAGYTWVGRGYSGRAEHLVALLVDALRHPGSSFIQILTPCVTHNAERAYDYLAARVEALAAPAAAGDLAGAVRLAGAGDKTALGVLHRVEVPRRQERGAPAASGEVADWRARLARLR